MKDLAGVLPAVLIAGFAATYVWRLAGVLAINNLAGDSEFMIWVRAMVTALVAALVMKIIVVPPALLATTALASRGIALGAGITVFAMAGRKIEWGVATAIATLFAGELIRQMM